MWTPEGTIWSIMVCFHLNSGTTGALSPKLSGKFLIVPFAFFEVAGCRRGKTAAVDFTFRKAQHRLS